MKKIILSFLVLPLASLAQPTINTIVPNYGDSVNIVALTDLSTWDFKSPTRTGIFPVNRRYRSLHRNYAQPCYTAPCSQFPECEFWTANQGRWYGYGHSVWSITADSIWGMATTYWGMPALD